MTRAPDSKPEEPDVPDWVRAKVEQMIASGQCRRAQPVTAEEIGELVAWLFEDPRRGPVPDPVGGGAWSINSFGGLVYLPAPGCPRSGRRGR